MTTVPRIPHLLFREGGTVPIFFGVPSGIIQVLSTSDSQRGGYAQSEKLRFQAEFRTSGSQGGLYDQSERLRFGAENRSSASQGGRYVG